MIVPKHFENLNVLHENTMPSHSYYIPASRPMGVLVHNREESDRMQLLNGNWKFRCYKSIYDLNEPFYQKKRIWNRMMKFRYRETGRISDMTVISMPMYSIRFHWIRRMCR